MRTLKETVGQTRQTRQFALENVHLYVFEDQMTKPQPGRPAISFSVFYAQQHKNTVQSDIARVCKYDVL